MIFSALTNWLYRKAKLRRRDLIFVAFFFGIFYFSKNFILESYLKIASKSYNENLVSKNLGPEYKKYLKNDFEKALLIKENERLKKLLNLPIEKYNIEKHKKQVIFAKILTNIFSSSSFWVVVTDSSKIKKSAQVWVYEFDNGISYQRLIGFVESINGSYIKVLPITHNKIRFSAQTMNGVGLLLKGNNRKLKIILTNIENMKDLIGQIVMLDNKLVGKIVNKNEIVLKNFANIKWVCIE